MLGIIVKVLCLLAIIGSLEGYTFKCFERSLCTCNTDEEFIDCEGFYFQKFPEMDFGRLGGFSRLNLRLNMIENFDINEETLLKRLPQLKIIDLNANPVNCKTLPRFTKITILSRCLQADPITSTQAPTTTESDTEDLDCVYKDYFCGWKQKLEKAYIRAYAHAHHYGGKVVETTRKIPFLKSYFSDPKKENENKEEPKIVVD